MQKQEYRDQSGFIWNALEGLGFHSVTVENPRSESEKQTYCQPLSKLCWDLAVFFAEGNGPLQKGFEKLP